MRGEDRSGDSLKKVKGLKNMCEGPVEMDNGVGIDCGNGRTVWVEKDKERKLGQL